MSSSRLLLRRATQTASRHLPQASFQQHRNFHFTAPKMTVHNLQTAEAFKEAIAKNKVVMLDCFATWCGPCKAIAPVLAEMSNEDRFKDIFFAKIDVDELPELSQELGIRAMPTFLMFTDGDKSDELVGANPKALTAMIEKGVSA